ncbi:bifunctional riboflavin kinase/FAD synthetase [Maridesulfovibrio salexigens]|uniref:Riboflavin biosynthesis protein n=1 Tax=Maridesulfovibrio salexigens (strain ATCC 14822 / DSM 2638 / NCIMB 8403 / VKM B-1763) TaxID=526222 RepID=C6C0N6_MARSD|nr:bifunctional riboflavin kinase/FAD synthetase [Maridesulfovibrio salexigens]ACS80983.1 riboflavin biosynthesis protein RibF [Maridesulfovibrio salexigens DSM 2638]
MIIAKSIDEIIKPEQGACVTIGNFDGVHKGHQKLISSTCKKARANGLASVVVTFDPHPLRVLVNSKTPPFITLTSQKLELIALHKPDIILALNFTKEMAALSPEEFIQRYLIEPLGMKEMVVGYDYALGKGRSGNYETIVKLGQKHEYGVERLDPVIINDAVVSSSRIRDMVSEGNVWDVRPLLGRFYQVRGEVVHGMNRGGRLLGFPTANIKLEDELFPKKGVYAIRVEVEGKVLPGVANIGKNPTFGNEALSVEAHILDFSKDIYGKDIRVHFIQRIRSEKKFNGLDELKERIGIDIGLAREILSYPESQVRPGLHLSESESGAE